MTSKQTSRWNFLQQAVASVESKLDNILAEEGEVQKRPSTPSQTSHAKRCTQPPAVTVPPRLTSFVASADLSRSNSNASISNDRLQERLARAMAKKSINRTESPVPNEDQTSTGTSGADTSATAPEGAKVDDLPSSENFHLEPPIRSSNEAAEESQEDGILKSIEGDLTVSGVDVAIDVDPQTANTRSPARQELDAARHSIEGQGDGQNPSGRPSTDMSRTSQDAPLRPGQDEIAKMQEEMNVFVERIDALHAKLQYLSKEAAESAKQAAASAASGSLEKKISEKDEKIALLIEEGTKLSKTEMKHLTTIKKIRAQAIGCNKEQEVAKLRAEKAERALKVAEERARKAEAASKRAEQSLMGVNDAEAVRKERDALHTTLTDMKSQLSKANSRAEAAETKAQLDQLEKERKKTTELQDDLTSAKVEREISEDKLRREIRDLQASLEREKEQSRAMESEMLGEQAALESKVESFRVRAEEASSADHGHVQAKLLRQIETLQSQYATASQNWQGIESSLLGRITAVEKERDEVVARETDLRKKLRDTILKLKHVERVLDDSQTKYMDMDKSLADANQETQRLNRKAGQLETDLANTMKDLEEQKVNAERELQRKVDEERAKWTATLHIQRTESPGTSVRKGSSMGLDLNHLMSPNQYDRASSRRPSMMPNFDSNTPPRQPSTTSFRGLANGSIVETPSVVTSMDADEYFANVPPTPLSASHHSHRGVNDLISTSTVGAGPSVQLVERMSANVRRLESEKAASKDELARITTQRDEARQQVVSLMREVEEKRNIEDRLTSLEKEHQSLGKRHQTTLELLGEKSEQVEELKADIVDVKQMYRQLADTMK